ncbi:MAG: cation:proton antiporter, partial [Cyanobacteria bacterium P01_H01_bin.153]
MMLSTFSLSPILGDSLLASLPTTLASTGGAEGEAAAKILAVAVTLATVAIFVSAQILGEIAVRLGLPAVLGELIAGFIIGVSGV